MNRVYLIFVYKVTQCFENDLRMVKVSFFVFASMTRARPISFIRAHAVMTNPVLIADTKQNIKVQKLLLIFKKG